MPYRNSMAAAAAVCVCRARSYEVEAMYFDSHVRAEHQDKLREALQEQLEPAFSSQLRLLAGEQLSGFDKDLKVALVEQPEGFSAAAQQAAAAALDGFDDRAQEFLVPGTSLTGQSVVVVGLAPLLGSAFELWMCQRSTKCACCNNGAHLDSLFLRPCTRFQTTC